MYYACFVLLMLMPVAMAAVGIRWYLKPPAYRTGRIAYRTAVTERSPEVWYFAHTHCGKLWGRFGFILGVISALGMVFLKSYYQNFWLWLIVAQMAVFCVTIVIIDTLCKNLFDEEGKLIDNNLKIDK